MAASQPDPVHELVDTSTFVLLKNVVNPIPGFPIMDKAGNTIIVPAVKKLSATAAAFAPTTSSVKRSGSFSFDSDANTSAKTSPKRRNLRAIQLPPEFVPQSQRQQSKGNSPPVQGSKPPAADVWSTGETEWPSQPPSETNSISPARASEPPPVDLTWDSAVRSLWEDSPSAPSDSGVPHAQQSPARPSRTLQRQAQQPNPAQQMRTRSPHKYQQPPQHKYQYARGPAHQQLPPQQQAQPQTNHYHHQQQLSSQQANQRHHPQQHVPNNQQQMRRQQPQYMPPHNAKLGPQQPPPQQFGPGRGGQQQQQQQHHQNLVAVPRNRQAPPRGGAREGGNAEDRGMDPVMNGGTMPVFAR